MDCRNYYLSINKAIASYNNLIAMDVTMLITITITITIILIAIIFVCIVTFLNYFSYSCLKGSWSLQFLHLLSLLIRS